MGIDLNMNLFQPPDFSERKNDVDTSKTDKGHEVASVSLPSVTDETENVTVGEILRQVSLACEMPELYPKANATALELQERYESLTSKLTRARGQAFHGKSVMFDIYAMMDMIQEISQRMRNVMRELRRLENTAIYANIKAQAEIQRQAAIAGLIMGAVMCAVQVGVVVVGMGMQLKGGGVAGKNGMMKTATNTENIGNNLGKSPIGGKPSPSAMKVNSFKESLSPQQRAEVTKNYDSVAKLSPEEMSERATLQSNTTKGTQRERQSAILKLNDFDRAHGIARGSDGSLVKRDGMIVKKISPEMQNEAIANDVSAAKKDYIAAQDKYQSAQETIDHGGKLPEGTTLDGLKKDAELKGLKYEYAVAKQVDVANTTKMSPEGMKGLKSQIAGDAQQIRHMAIHGMTPGANPGGMNSVKGIMIQQVGMAVGQFLQQIAVGVKELISAKGTELQAEQKLLEEQFDQIKDLFALQQSVIEKSIQIFSSVIQKESSVLEQIFQHI